MVGRDSIEGWLALAQQHENAARDLVRRVASQAHWHAGIATECAIKAFIMRKERLNSWPSRSARRDLYTHDLRVLQRIAGITVPPTDRTAPAWHVLLQWDRNQGYDPKPMPRKVARAMVDAAFGPDGVVTWIRQSLT